MSNFKNTKSGEAVATLQLLVMQDQFDRLLDSEKTIRRSFNSEEREAIYIVAGGRCQNPKCGVVLDDGWEPDHIIPFSKGGVTDVTNGQALCVSCNRKKGAKSDGY
jgi:5-methylcytosine-specific restriction endonuclease McrA